MKWNNREIAELTDGELQAASEGFVKMKTNLDNSRTQVKFVNKFKNQPVPNINETFLQLENEINAEILKRKKQHG